ncbi:MAG: FG-GAP-like repeat-containing protein [Chloroflexota bacterium]
MIQFSFLKVILLILILPTGTLQAALVYQTSLPQIPSTALPHLTNVGDVNGDGWDDFILGEPFAGPEIKGRIRLYLGTADGPANEPSWEILGTSPRALLGFVVVGIGDINADGLGDVAVSAPMWREGSDENIQGQVLFLGGNIDGTLTRLARVPGEVGASLGMAIQALGDINDDGVSDVAVFGKLERDDRGAMETALVFYGTADAKADYDILSYGELQTILIEQRAANLAAIEPESWEPTRAWQTQGKRTEFFGWNTTILGDINGDSFDDLAINSLGIFDDDSSGRVLLFLGSENGVGDSPDWQAGIDDWARVAGWDPDLLSYRVMGVGDVNGDGFDDMATNAVQPFSDNRSQVLLYYGGADGFAQQPDWIVRKLDDQPLFAFKTEALGDLNGDGYDDIGILHQNSMPFVATALIYYGSENGFADEPDWILDSIANGQTASFAGIGDINGDGYDDVAIQPTTDDETEGQLRLYFGSPSGLTEPAEGALDVRQIAQEGVPTKTFGVAPLGDLNQDGLDDFGWITRYGAIIFYGTEQDLLQMPFTVLNQDTGVPGMAINIARAGDVNGDGYGDLFLNLGDPRNERGESTWMLFLGGPNGVMAEPIFQMFAPMLDEDYLLYQTVGAGDLDGDGFDDVAITSVDFGALRDDPSYQSVVEVRYGGPAEGKPREGQDQALVSPLIWGHGASPKLDEISDINGDGFVDYAQSAPFDGSDLEGKVTLYAGTEEGMAGNELDTLYGEEAAALFGYAISGVGDINQDGVDDFVVTAPLTNGGAGAIYLWGGSADGPPELLWVHEGDPGSVSGLEVVELSDINTDGFADFATISQQDLNQNGIVEQVTIHTGSQDSVGASEPTAYAEFESQLAAIQQRTMADIVPVAWHPSASSPIRGSLDELVGMSATIVGDINGDGFDDVAIDVLRESPDDPGGVWLDYGGPDGIDGRPDWYTPAVSIDGRNRQFVLRITGIGDVNADGFDDFVLHLGDFEDWDEIQLFYGAADGPAEEPGWRDLSSAKIRGRLLRVEPIGDLNGDGFSDIGLLFRKPNGPTVDLLIHYGGKSGVSSLPNRVIEQIAFSIWSPPSIANVGDINQDGFDDFIVGEPDYSRGQDPANAQDVHSQGRIQFWAGGAEHDDPQLLWEHMEDVGEFGYSVAGLGDTNGDGTPDFAVSAPEAGFVTIYHTTPQEPESWTTTTLQSDIPEAGHRDTLGFGLLLIPTGDINGDGLADMLVISRSDPDPESPFVNQLFLGKNDGLLTEPMFEWSAPRVRNEFLIYQTHGSGNVNGDEFADLLLGSNQLSTLFRGGRPPIPNAELLYGGPAQGATAANVASNDDNSNFTNSSPYLKPPADGPPKRHPAWTTFANTVQMNDLLLTADTLWMATNGGVVAWDLETDEYIRYGSEHGLAGNITHTILQKDDGTIWAAGPEGVSYLDADGLWRTMPESTDPERGLITQLLPGAIDDLWVNRYQDGFAYISSQGEWVDFDAFVESLGTDDVRVHLASRDRSVWVAAKDRGIVRLQPGGKTEWYGDGVGGLEIFTVFEDSTGAIWFGSTAHLRQFDAAGKWFDYTKADGLLDANIESAMETSSGELWFATPAGVNRLAPDGTWSNLTAEDGLPSSAVRHVVESSDGSIWLATGSFREREEENPGIGVSRLLPTGEWQHYTSLDGLADDYVSKIIEGPDGSIWFGTWLNGTSRLAPDGTWTLYRTDDPLPTHFIDRFYATTNGSFWFESRDGFWELKSSGETRNHERKVPGVFLSMAEGEEGTIWLAGRAGLTQLDRDGVEVRNMRGPDYTSMTLAQDGTLWLVHQFGVTVMDYRGEIQEILENEKLLTDGKLDTLLAASDGSVWLGVGGSIRDTNPIALIQVESDGSMTTYGVEDGLPSNKVWSMIEGQDGTLWFGSTGGIARRDATGEWTTYPFAEEMSDYRVQSMAQTADGTLWFYGYNREWNVGIHRLDPSGEIATYRSADGLAENRVSKLIADEDDVLWIATYSGLTRLDTELLKE